jgi:hypothetical protein
MNKLIFIFAACFFTANLFAYSVDSPKRGNGLLRFLAEKKGIRNLALYSVMNNRCIRYMSLGERPYCQQAIAQMIFDLDFDVVFLDEKNRPIPKGEKWSPSSFVFVAFKQNLLGLLNSSKTTTYLNDLNQSLNDFARGDISEMNIWDLTRRHYKTDYLSAMVIATLFQDTSIMKLHVGYLDRMRSPQGLNFQTNKELLSRIINTINLILDSSEDHYRELFYPKEIQKDLNRNIYHFYVPLYLSMLLNKNGIPKGDAFSAVLMLTLSYEFVTAAEDYRYLFQDPNRITDVQKIKDIFGGYCGSSLGAKGPNFFKSFEAIRAAFERSTEDGVDLLLRN